MDLGDVGEFGAIARIAERLGERSVVASDTVGIGDDAAVIPAGDGTSQLFTVDTMVGGVDFLADTSAEYAGFKIVAAGASDIAAMGGTPSAAVMSITCPRSTDIEWIEALYDGVSEGSEHFDISILGGDTGAGPTIVLTVAVLGACAPPAPILRSGAKPGDVVCVTGTLGGAAAGLRILGIERTLKKPEQDYGHAGLRLLERHLKPIARLEAGRALAGSGATAMIDVSDGLLADLGHICERSGFSMTINAEQVPIDPDMLEVADRVVHDALVVGLTGGEDFELALTLPAGRFDEAADAVRATGTTLTKIGRVDERLAGDEPVRLLKDGEKMSIGRAGWAHFGEDEQDGS